MQKLNEFEVELSTRIALHEVLLEHLFAHLLEGNPNARKQWTAVGEGVVRVMGSLSNRGGDMEDHQAHFLRAQRERGKVLAANFVEKVMKHLPPQG